jgi:DNA-binding transcriptional ArsR family regulator
MAIRFKLPADRPDLVSFAYSPVLEAVLSLSVFVAPKHHPLQHPWVRRMRRLPAELKREIAEFSFAYRCLIPDFLYPSPSAGYGTFEEELDALLALDPIVLAFDFTRPLYDHGGDRDPAALARPAMRETVEARAQAMGAGPACATLALDDPEELARRFTHLLEWYWEEAFREEWARLEPKLARTVSDAGASIARDGVYSLLATLAPRLRVELARERFGIDVPHDHEVEITEVGELVLVPSAYVWPHLHLNCDPPWPYALVYSAPFMADGARREIPPDELVQLLRAVGDRTRLNMLRLIAERPRTTQELAPLVGISEAGLSKHLRILREAGLVSSRREGYYVLYSFVPDSLSPLSVALSAFVGRNGS